MKFTSFGIVRNPPTSFKKSEPCNDGHQDEESDSEEDLAEGRARLRRILWLTVRLGIPNIRPEGGPHP